MKDPKKKPATPAPTPLEQERDVIDDPDFVDDDCRNDWDDPFGNQNETLDGMD